MPAKKIAYFRNALDLRDRVQVRIIRRRLKLSNGEFDAIVRKSGNALTAINKEAVAARSK